MSGIQARQSPFVQTAEVLRDVMGERRRQDEKWGQQNHGPMPWSAILGEEFGEVCKAGLELEFGEYDGPAPSNEDVRLLREQRLDHLEEELVQVAAVAVSWVECIRRNRS